MIALDGIIYSLQKNGGVSVYYNKLIKALSKARVNTEVFTYDAIKGNLERVAKLITINRPLRILERYRECIIDSNTKIFHSSYYRQSSNKKVPTVVTAYDFVYERYVRGPKLWAHRRQKNLAIRSAQSIICISETTKKDLLKFVGISANQKIYVIPCGVSDDYFPLETKESLKPFIVFVGQRAGYKNFKLVTLALKHLVDINLFCVGGGAIKAEELNHLDEKTRIRIKYLGYVEDEYLNVLYNQAICLVYPSIYEGFGIPVIEAMKAGCPVVALNAPAIIEVGGEALVISEEPEEKALADAINITRSSSRENIIVNGCNNASKYSWDKTHQQTINVYRELADV